jgi:hypothetical protein
MFLIRFTGVCCACVVRACVHAGITYACKTCKRIRLIEKSILNARECYLGLNSTDRWNGNETENGVKGFKGVSDRLT